MLDIEQIGREYQETKRQQAQQENEIDLAFLYGWLIGVIITSICWLVALWTHIIQVTQ